MYAAGGDKTTTLNIHLSTPGGRPAKLFKVIYYSYGTQDIHLIDTNWHYHYSMWVAHFNLVRAARR